MSDSEDDIRVEGFEDSNDFEIHEHYSDIDHENEDLEDSTYTFPEEGFPVVEHRSKSSENFASSYDGEDVIGKPVEEMTEEEIAAAQRELVDKLGKETCDFLVQRRLEKMQPEGEIDEQPPVDGAEDHPREDDAEGHIPAGKTDDYPSADEVEENPPVDDIDVQPPIDEIDEPLPADESDRPPEDEVYESLPEDEDEEQSAVDANDERLSVDDSEEQSPVDEVYEHPSEDEIDQQSQVGEVDELPPVDEANETHPADDVKDHPVDTVDEHNLPVDGFDKGPPVDEIDERAPEDEVEEHPPVDDSEGNVPAHEIDERAPSDETDEHPEDDIDHHTPEDKAEEHPVDKLDEPQQDENAEHALVDENDADSPGDGTEEQSLVDKTDEHPAEDAGEEHPSADENGRDSPADETGAQPPVDEIDEPLPVDESDEHPVDEIVERSAPEEDDAYPPIDDSEEQPVDETDEHPSADEVDETPPLDEIDERSPVEDIEKLSPVDKVEENPPVDENDEHPVDKVDEPLPADEMDEHPLNETVEHSPVDETDEPLPVDKVNEHPPEDEAVVPPAGDEIDENLPADETDDQPPAEEVDEQPPVNVSESHEKVENKVFENVVEFKMDEFEALKFEWMEPKPAEAPPASADGHLLLHQLKFDLHGHPVTNTSKVASAEDIPNDIHLVSHDPGYTIPELLNLLQSSYKPQVQVAIKALTNVIQNSYSPRESYFGYEAYRWNVYIYEDIDLLGKVGYVACNSKCSITVADALRCLALLTLGDLSGDKPIVPFQDSLFPYHFFGLGAKLFHSSPYSLDPFDVKVEHLKFLNSVDVDQQNTPFAEFFRKCIEGEFVDLEVAEIFDEYKQVLNLQVNDLHDHVTLDPLLLCIAKGNLVRRLLWILDNHKNAFGLLLYSLKLLCGLLCRFKTALADALVANRDFVEAIEKYVSILILGTVENAKCNSYSEDQQRLLTHTLLYIIKYMSVYASNAFNGFCEVVSAVALMKQTLRKIYNSVFDKLEQGVQENVKQVQALDASWAPLGCVVLNTFTVWALKDEFYDHLVEMFPVVDHEIVYIDSVIRKEGCYTGTSIGANAALLAQLLLHVAVCMAKDSNFDFQNCYGFWLGLNSFTSFLSILAVDQWNEITSILLYSTIKLHCCYIEHYPNKSPDFYQKQSPKVNEFVKSCEKLASLVETTSLDSSHLEMIKYFEPKRHPSIDKPIHNNNELFDSLLTLVTPLEVVCSLLHLKGISDGELGLVDYGQESAFRRLRDKLAHIAFSMHKSKNEIKSDSCILSSPYGSTSPMLLLEGWAKYLYKFHLLGPSPHKNEDAMALVAILTISCDYSMVSNVLAELHNGYTPVENIDDSKVNDVASGFKKFNELLHSINAGAPNVNFPMINFVSYLEIVPILALDAAVTSVAYDTFSHCIKGPNAIKHAFLQWLNPFKSLLQLSNAISDDLDLTNLSLLEISESLVFKRFTRPTMHVIMSPRFLECEYMANLVERLVEDCDGDDRAFIVYTDENLTKLKVLVQSLIKLYNGTAGDSPLVVALLLLYISNVSHFELAKLIWQNSDVMLSLSKSVYIDSDNLQLVAKVSEDYKVSAGSILNFLPSYNGENAIKSVASALLREFYDDAVVDKNGILLIAVATLHKYSRGDLVAFKNELDARPEVKETVCAFIDKVLQMSE